MPHQNAGDAEGTAKPEVIIEAEGYGSSDTYFIRFEQIKYYSIGEGFAGDGWTVRIHFGDQFTNYQAVGWFKTEQDARIGLMRLLASISEILRNPAFCGQVHIIHKSHWHPDHTVTEAE